MQEILDRHNNYFPVVKYRAAARIKHENIENSNVISWLHLPTYHFNPYLILTLQLEHLNNIGNYLIILVHYSGSENEEFTQKRVQGSHIRGPKTKSNKTKILEVLPKPVDWLGFLEKSYEVGESLLSRHTSSRDVIVVWLSWTKWLTILWENFELHLSDSPWLHVTWCDGSVFLFLPLQFSLKNV
jgi:hypothetical protein